MDRLTNALRIAVQRVWQGAATWDDVKAIMAKIDHLQVDARVGVNILGRMSPWQKSAQYNKEDAYAFNMAIAEVGTVGGEPQPGSAYRFPQLEKALKWLHNRGIATLDEFKRLSAIEQQQVFSAPGINSPQALEDLKKAVGESLKIGESFANFRKRIDRVVNLKKHEEELVYRTETKRAYVDGLDGTIRGGKVATKFPYVEYTATHDTRTRPTHRELDGKVAKIGSTLYDVMIAALKEPRCRCNIIPITEARADQLGINTVGDLDQMFRDKFKPITL